MLAFKNGNLLQAKENIICHQVNTKGVMGGGLALQIAKCYPKLKRAYENFCNLSNYDYKKLKGKFQKVIINKEKTIVNCFTQKDNFETDYEAIEKCFSEILYYAKRTNQTVAIPYKYGCGIATGDWGVIKNILDNLSLRYQVNISIYKLEEK